ncbi:hypothetical protein C8J57DRAFT_1507678 [Mycena rebaudengoi]|nr:hypothetical protein C8J57DRAFT_1507678 [Mycena rebaudengoi]
MFALTPLVASLLAPHIILNGKHCPSAARGHFHGQHASRLPLYSESPVDIRTPIRTHPSARAHRSSSPSDTPPQSFRLSLVSLSTSPTANLARPRLASAARRRDRRGQPARQRPTTGVASSNRKRLITYTADRCPADALESTKIPPHLASVIGTDIELGEPMPWHEVNLMPVESFVLHFSADELVRIRAAAASPEQHVPIPLSIYCGAKTKLLLSGKPYGFAGWSYFVHRSTKMGVI